MEIDRLELNLQGTSETGTRAIDSLISGLDRLGSVLKDVSSPIGSASRQLDKLAASFEKISKASGMTGAMEAAANSLKGVSEQAQNMQGVTTRAFQQSASEAKRAGQAEKQAQYESRLEAKVAAQEQIQQARAEAAERIAQAKAAQQIQVAQEKERIASEKRISAKQSQASAIEAAMAEKRRVEQEQLDALIQKTIKDSSGQYIPKTNQSPYIPDNDTTPAGNGKTATAIMHEQQEAARAAEESGAQQISVLERVQAWAERVGASFRRMTQAASSSAPDSEMGILNSKLAIANERITLQITKLRQLQVAYGAAVRESGSIRSPMSQKAQENILTARSRLASLRSEVNRLHGQMNSLKSGTDSTSNSMRRLSLSSIIGLHGTNNLSNAFGRMGRQLASQLFIYSLIWPAISKIGQYMWAALKTSNEFSSALNNLKAQLLTAFYPIYQAALPAIISLTNALAKALQYVAAFTAGLFGTTYSAAKSGASALNKNIASMEDQTAAAKAASTESRKWETYNRQLTKQQKEYAAAVAKAEERQAKLNEKLEETKKSLMGFDEINQLEKINSDYETVKMPEEPTPPMEPSPSTATMPSTTGDLSGILGTDFNTKQLIPQSVIDQSEAAGEKLRQIFQKISDIVNFNKIKGNISRSLSAITLLISGAALALGAILTFSGANIPLGMGLMVVGAAGVASALALNWDGLNQKTKESIDNLTAIVSSAMLAVGAVLTFTNISPALGIPMMLIGASSLVTAVAINWNSTDQKLKSALSKIMLTIGTASFAIGTVLAFSGGAIPLGIALMAIGASEMVGAAALNWNNVGAKVRTIISEITTVISSAALAVGAVLAFSGGHTPLGIALMAVGAAGIVSVVAMNWEGLSIKTRNAISAISAIVGGAMLTLGAVLAFSGVGIPLGISLMAVGAASLVTVVALNWGAVGGKIREVLASILAIASTASFAIGLMLCLTGIGIPLGISMIIAGVAGKYAASKISDTPITNMVKSMGEKLKAIFFDIKDSAIKNFTDARSGAENAWSNVGPWFNDRKVDIQNAFGDLGGWFGDAFQSGRNNAQDAWSGVGSWFGGRWGDIRGAFGDVGGWFSSVFNGAVNGIQGAFNSLPGFFSGIWSNITSGARSGVNEIIWLLNQFLSGIEWPFAQVGKVPGFGWASGIGSARIPYLATGGIVTAPTLTVTGDQGAEAVLPLENNLGYMDKLADRIADRMGEGASGDSRPIQIIVEIGSERLVNRVIKGINQKQLASGKVVLSV